MTKIPIIYNVTVHVEDSVSEEWTKWMKEKHIPDVMETGYFSEYKFSKILAESDQGGQSFSIQYLAHSMNDLHEYQSLKAAQLQKEHTEKYGEKCLAFRTLLELISKD